MALAACAAAADARSAAASDGCQTYIDSWHYLTNNADFQALPLADREKLFHRYIKAADKLTPHATKFCEEVAEIIDAADELLRPDR